MKKTVSIYDFRAEFKKYDRYDSFSYHGYEVLFDYFEQLEEDCNFEIELDCIAICCDWSEDTLINVLKEYDIEDAEDLKRETTVLHVEGDGSDPENDIIIYESF